LSFPIDTKTRDIKAFSCFSLPTPTPRNWPKQVNIVFPLSVEQVIYGYMILYKVIFSQVGQLTKSKQD